MVWNIVKIIKTRSNNLSYVLHCDISEPQNHTRIVPLIGMDDVVSHTNPRSTQDFWRLGIYSLIYPAAMEIDAISCQSPHPWPCSYYTTAPYGLIKAMQYKHDWYRLAVIIYADTAVNWHHIKFAAAYLYFYTGDPPHPRMRMRDPPKRRWVSLSHEMCYQLPR